jgi:putative hydrolase of the HAD superfamily
VRWAARYAARLVTRIDAVLLDVGGVFFLPSPERIGAILGRAGVTLTHDRAYDEAHYRGIAAIDDFREGDEEVWATYNRAYARSCGVPDDALADTVSALMSEFTVGGLWTRRIPGARDALTGLAALDVALAIVSNSDGTVEQLLSEQEVCQVGPGPGVPVDAILDSTVVGAAKPDPKIFELALARLDVAPEHAIHVGDTPGADVEGAIAAGVTPVLVDPLDLHTTLDVTRVRALDEVVALVAGSRPRPANGSRHDERAKN